MVYVFKMINDKNYSIEANISIEDIAKVLESNRFSKWRIAFGERGIENVVINRENLVAIVF